VLSRLPHQPSAANLAKLLTRERLVVRIFVRHGVLPVRPAAPQTLRAELLGTTADIDATLAAENLEATPHVQ
jgi:hypothetical protein